MNEITNVVEAEATVMVVVNGRRLNRILRRRWNIPRTHLLLI
jgi:nitrogenase molybdenum-iron protein alpha/beta subunit